MRRLGLHTGTNGRTGPHEDEFAIIISGKVGIIDNNDGTEEIFITGESFFPRKGSSLTWVVYEPVRKFYMTAS